MLAFRLCEKHRPIKPTALQSLCFQGVHEKDPVANKDCMLRSVCGLDCYQDLQRIIWTESHEKEKKLQYGFEQELWIEAL